jgi:hypothetical protein
VPWKLLKFTFGNYSKVVKKYLNRIQFRVDTCANKMGKNVIAFVTYVMAGVFAITFSSILE